MLKGALNQTRGTVSGINAWRKQNPLWFIVIVLLSLAIFAFILIADLDTKTVLELILFPLVIALAVAWLNGQQNKRENELQIDGQQQSTLQAYYAIMTELLGGKGLGSDIGLDKTTRVIARAVTLSVFRNLDPNRNAAILRFLGDAELLAGEKLLDQFDMANVNLSNSSLRNARLVEANLGKVNLVGADLSGTNLRRANFSGADLSGAKLQNATLFEAHLGHAKLGTANLHKANLVHAYLSEADLSEADLSTADIAGANLSGVILSGANLNGTTYTKDTKWPNGFKPTEVGAVLVDNFGNPKGEEE